MSDDIDRLKDLDKINRTILRLRHSLAYDRERRAQIAQSKELLVRGVLPKVQINLKELLGDQ